MYSNERRFGAAPVMPDPSTKKPADDSKVAKVSQEIAADTQRPVMEENVKTPEQKPIDTNKLVDSGKSGAVNQAATNTNAEVERPIVDAAKAMEDELKNVGPNIKPIEFRESVSSDNADTGNSQINVVNANGIVSGVKLVNGMWRSIAIAFLIVIIILVAGVVWLYMQNTKTTEDYQKLSETSSKTSSNLNALYSKLGATTQEEASFAAGFGNVMDGAAISSLHNALTARFGVYDIDYGQTEFNSFKRIDAYKIAQLAISGKKYVVFAKSDNNWTIVEFVETLHDRCEGYEDEARLIVDKILTCKED